MSEEDRRRPGLPMAESAVELRNVRVLLEEGACWPRNLAYHRRARLETTIGRALEEVDRQIEDLRANGASWSFAVEAEYCVRMRRTVPGVIMLRSDWKD